MLYVTPDSIESDLKKIRHRKPLIHNITNYVSMNATANALLALGASPIMAHAQEEMAELGALTEGLVVNIGTLSASWIESMKAAIHMARAQSKPIVIDPVGAGATAYRTQTALDLFDVAPPTVIRGNGSEILGLDTRLNSTKGVDSRVRSEDALEAAQRLATRYSCTVVISGATDYIVAPNERCSIRNGSSMMTKVTGMGCIATTFVAAFCTVNANPGLAAAHGMAVMGICGELASARSQGPGAFFPVFLDAVANLSLDDLNAHLRQVPG